MVVDSSSREGEEISDRTREKEKLAAVVAVRSPATIFSGQGRSPYVPEFLQQQLSSAAFGLEILRKGRGDLILRSVCDGNATK